MIITARVADTTPSEQPHQPKQTSSSHLMLADMKKKRDTESYARFKTPDRFRSL
ncbi:uncharacterized protein BP01DRAFT_226098 [Aspergillus saccharolyticus JOP 1030-1]|uniref:Uncharacterized protein n=1 Tax=Aspergillus saccharolyticus JOP 1030-1 TaxID=1450539 RepID=A0A318Z617_9EURO|nr:hypothetical protein BP01DRAFT_226098 [Aspergillus saccharolyticus JOP 1030-1]PYH40203.1 hypothetical protein BP01DRAFT_226098 [Aspergillus saccharolyticus JOP 1030-1]